MNAILLLQRSSFAALAVVLMLLPAGCGKQPVQENGPPSTGYSPAPIVTDGETTATAEATPTPQPVPETAPFFSERFLPPDQRLQRRQERILQVLEEETTFAAQQP